MNIAPFLKTGTLRKPRIGGRRINSKTKPHKLTACLYAANIGRRFVPRTSWPHECEIETEGGVSVIISFDPDGIRLSAFAKHKPQN